MSVDQGEVVTFVTKTNNAHIHEWIKIDVKKIVRVHQEYKGITGDKAFLVRICKCKKMVPFEYGDTIKMRELLKELNYRKEHGV